MQFCATQGYELWSYALVQKIAIILKDWVQEWGKLQVKNIKITGHAKVLIKTIPTIKWKTALLHF